MGPPSCFQELKEFSFRAMSTAAPMVERRVLIVNGVEGIRRDHKGNLERKIAEIGPAGKAWGAGNVQS